MKNIIAILFVVSILFALTSCSNHEFEYDESAVLELARFQVNDMVHGSFGSTVDTFNEDMKNAIDVETLRETWKESTSELGEHIGEYSIESEYSDGYLAVTIVEEYENNGFAIRLVYETNSTIAGLFFNYSPISKELINNESFEEVAVTIGEEYPLDGILTLPKGVEHPPVVLLVHGSGATDKNSTIFSNSPFQDIAHGLAEQGIATLRYDKRFFTYPELASELGSEVTLEEEVLQDVEFALELLSNETRVDTSRIFVLGHSLSAGLTPYFAYSNENIYGIIAMAGSLRPLYEISYDQNKAIEEDALNGNFDDETTKEIIDQMEQVEADIEILRDNLNEISDEQVLLGLPAGYQKSAKEYAGENYIDEIDTPILVLQGTADFQVSADVDYRFWEETLEGRVGATLKLYDNLNHLMMQTNGKEDISDYQIKGTVSEEVIDEIAEFVKQ